MDRQQLENLRNQDWDGIFARLFRAAQILATRYGWNQDSSLPEGKMLEDVVIDAINELWADPSKVRDDIKITTQLGNIIRRRLWNLSQCDDESVKRCTAAGSSQSDEIRLAEHDARDYASRMTALFERAIGLLQMHPKINGRNDHELVLLAMADGALKAREIADLTDLPVERVYQVTREIQSTYPSIAIQMGTGEVNS